MDAHNNGVNDLNRPHKDTKKVAPIFNYKHFTGEESTIRHSEITGNEITLSELIKSCRVDLNEKLGPPPIAMQIMEGSKPVTVFTKGNFSIVTGKAKSKKTFLISMLMAAAVKGSLQDRFVCPSQGVNILFDTEQSRYKTQEIAKRIQALSGEEITPDKLEVFSMRTLDSTERIAMIEAVLSQTQNINFVAIDGIIDLDYDPILQVEQAQGIILKLMQWTEVYQIHIVCVLHFNKSIDTLLGHLGSISHRKADAVISVTKSKDDESISIVEPVDCREREFLPFAFCVDPDSLPHLLKDYAIEKKSKEKKGQPGKQKALLPVNLDKNVHSQILACVFKAGKEFSYQDLWRLIKNAVIQITGKEIGDNKAKDFLTYYVSTESIILTDARRKKYCLPGQSTLQLE